MTKSSSGTVKGAKKKNSVLLVEDDIFLGDIYAKALTQAGFSVLRAYDGVVGLETAQKKKPTLILLDILMPRMDGFETLEKLKADDITKKIPVSMLTNLSQKSDVDKCFAFGAADYMIKAQVTPQDIVVRVKKILS